VGDGDVAVGIQAPHRQLGVPVAQRGDDEPLLGVALAAVLHQLDHPDAPGQGGQQAAGVDGRKLLGIADQDHLGPGPSHLVGQVGHEPSAQHPRLIDHEDIAGPQTAPPGLEGVVEGVSGGRGDPRARLQLSCSPGRQADAQHPMAR